MSSWFSNFLASAGCTMPIDEANGPPSYTFDLYSAIPYATLDDDTREKLWDDGLHLTGQGYKVMGDAIAVRLFEILQNMKEPESHPICADGP